MKIEFTSSTQGSEYHPLKICFDDNGFRRLCSVAFPCPVTFHRAFDVCEQVISSAISDIISCGQNMKTLLTSGRAKKAEGGAKVYELIRESIKAQQSDFCIMIGAGISPKSEQFLKTQNSISWVHGSFSTKSQFHNDIFELGVRFTTQTELVKEMVKLVDSL